MPDFFLLAFWLFAIAGFAISWRAGNRLDRWMIFSIILATIGSGLAFSLLGMKDALLCVALIDCALLGVVARYALTGDRYWPIWFASFHSCTVFFQIVAIFLPLEDGLVAWRVGAFWSLPALLAMTVGLLLDQRKGQTG